MDEYYKILGVKPDADESEIEEAYQSLKAEYSKDRFAEGEKGNNAAKNLTKLEEAYYEIMDSRKGSGSSNSENNSTDVLTQVADAVKVGNLSRAQDLLDSIGVRSAEWHYLQSVVFYKKNWVNESKKQLEIAITMDPSNEKYKKSYEKIISKMSYSNANFNSQFHSGNADYNGGYNNYNNNQMGGDGCMDCCTAYCCTQILCNSCCR